MTDLIEEIIIRLERNTAALGCTSEVEALEDIVKTAQVLIGNALFMNEPRRTAKSRQKQLFAISSMNFNTIFDRHST
ncbi:MAG: hypothetical protein OXE94_05950 [Aestuariivita sp.]|nr:hypothetical protein [Aestuariivita sp.]MCY4201483.1 hypothetical protein [Aestuariivita sp.]